MTFRPDTLARSLISCSASPSEKYFWSLAGLMSAKGSTAMELAFEEERVAVLRAYQKWLAIAVASTKARMGMIASLWKYWVRKVFICGGAAGSRATLCFCVVKSGGSVVR